MKIQLTSRDLKTLEETNEGWTYRIKTKKKRKRILKKIKKLIEKLEDMDNSKVYYKESNYVSSGYGEDRD
jgi:transcription initiation factor IIE alpha subunit